MVPGETFGGRRLFWFPDKTFLHHEALTASLCSVLLEYLQPSTHGVPSFALCLHALTLAVLSIKDTCSYLFAYRAHSPSWKPIFHEVVHSSNRPHSYFSIILAWTYKIVFHEVVGAKNGSYFSSHFLRSLAGLITKLTDIDKREKIKLEYMGMGIHIDMIYL